MFGLLGVYLLCGFFLSGIQTRRSFIMGTGTSANIFNTMTTSLITSSNIHKNKSVIGTSKTNHRPKTERKKLISISPGGIQGFYLAGICSYLKENFVLDDYIFSGASAGAWNALFMTYKGNSRSLIHSLLDEDDTHTENGFSLEKTRTIYDLECAIKNRLLSKYKTEDFDLDRLFIGMMTLQKCKFKLQIFSGFDDLEDALDACIASSHIPFITGGLTNVYHNMYTLDGGFSKYPYTKSIYPATLHITPSMFLPEEEKEGKNDMLSFLFSREKHDFKKLLEKGYHDARNNQLKL